MNEIRVKVEAATAKSGSYDLWLAIVYKRLHEAGIPVLRDLTVTSGTLHRLDDPTDFGMSEYVWTPPSQGGSE